MAGNKTIVAPPGNAGNSPGTAATQAQIAAATQQLQAGAGGSAAAIAGAAAYHTATTEAVQNLPETMANYEEQDLGPWLNYSPGMLAPTNAPSLWGLTVNDPNVGDQIYVGDSQDPLAVSNNARVNSVLGHIADALHLGRPGKGQTQEDQILAVLAGQNGIKVAKSGKLSNKQLDQLGHRMGINLLPTVHAPGQPIPNDAEGQLLASFAKGTGYDSGNAISGFWLSVANRMGVKVPGATDGMKPITSSRQQIAQSFLSMTGPEIQNLKAQLYNGGMYETKVYNDSTALKQIEGNQLDPYTAHAIGNLLNQTAASYKNGQKITWQQFLQQNGGGAGLPSGQNLSDFINGTATAPKGPPEPTVTPEQVYNTLNMAFRSSTGLGRNLTQNELQQFTQEFQALQQDKAARNPSVQADIAAGIPVYPVIDPDTGLQLQPGVPTVRNAAQTFVESAPDYPIHQLGDAAGLVAKAILGAGLGTTTNAAPMDTRVA